MSAHRQELLNAAESAVDQGKLDQAVKLLSGEFQSDWKGRRLAIDLHEQLISRCQQAIRNRNWVAAWESLRLLSELEGMSSPWDRLHQELLDEMGRWFSNCLSDGRIEDVEGTLGDLQRFSIESSLLTLTKEAVNAIRSARKLASLGRFAEAEVQLSDLMQVDRPWMEKERDRLQVVHSQAKQVLSQLHSASEGKDWERVMKLAQELLDLANRHPMAIQMKQRAAAELAAKGMSPRRVQEAPNPMAIAIQTNSQGGKSNLSESTPTAASPVLWIDGVGGFMLCDAQEVVIGQAVPGNNVELMVVGDLSRRASAIRRSGEDHLLQPLQSVSVNNVKIERATLLKDGDLLSLGQRVSMRYVKPNRLSATARLEILSRNRWQPSVDAVLLLGDSCILGPSSAAHILCPFWTNDVVLFRNRDQWMCRSSQPLEVDGKETKDAIPLIRGKRIRGTDFSMTLE